MALLQHMKNVLKSINANFIEINYLKYRNRHNLMYL